MADFAMCRGEAYPNEICPKRGYCRRYLATPSETQSYMEPPEPMVSCPEFWPVPYERDES
jgi:hypothetical protein